MLTSRFMRLARRSIPALAVLALAGGAPAQEKPAPDARTYFETAQVNLINVEVFVTDRAGKPVTGLTRDDFEVFEDGHPVTITNFYAAEGSAPQSVVAPGAAEKPAPAPEALLPVEQRLSVIVFVDDSGITEAARNLALGPVHDLLLSCLRIPHTQAMIVTLDKRAHVRQEFTSDIALLDAALAKVRKSPADPAAGAIGDALITRAMDRIELPSQPTDFSVSARKSGIESADFEREEALSLLSAIRSSVEASYERTRSMMASMSEFISSLAGFPGRKVVFYFGNGLPMRPGESLLQRWETRFGNANLEPGFSAGLEASQTSLTSEFHNVVARANSDRVMFYAIDARGSAQLRGASAEQALLDPEPGSGDSEELSKVQSLLYLTSATGGTTIASTPRPSPALDGALEDLQTYYSLAYAAPRIGDGKEHAITVKVRREGVKVRYRRHYMDKTADDRVIERNLSALLHNSGSNSLNMDISVGSPTRRDGKVFTVPLLVTVPLDKLLLVQAGEAHHGSVSIFIAAKDLDDRITPPVKRIFPITIPNDKLNLALGQSAQFVFEMLMTRGPQTVAVSLRDDLASVESTVSARFTVAEPARRSTIPGQGS
jgi:VWFA-related protein